MNKLAISKLTDTMITTATDQSLPQGGASIQLQQLNKNYANQTVLHDLNLHIHPGEFVVVVGRSGCGKSTLLRLIANLEQPSHGHIIYNSAAQNQQSCADIDIRVMFQDPRLLPWKKILDNVTLGLAKQQHATAKKLIEKVGLQHKTQLWPAQLSGGQRQRVALARALSHHPQLLLLDEPLSALDALTRLEMQQLIEQLWQERGFTAILVTHDVSEAVLLADRIILLEQGHISAQFHVDLARPRSKNADFAQIEQHVLQAVFATK